MKVSEQLFEEVKDLWESYHTHPFVKELGEGTLAADKFRFYMIQDYLYLLEYAKVFAMGVVKSKEEGLMRKFSAMVHNTLDGEMSLHKSYMSRLGITEKDLQEAKQSLSNRSYTSYMLEVAYNQGVLEILVAILSCAWSYEEIGKRHALIPKAKEHPLFGQWVQGYSSQEYIQETHEIIDLVDELGQNISPEELENLKDIFVRCSRYEYAFWDMAYKKEL